MNDEQAKAVQEVAKSSGQLIEATKRVGSFISKVIGGASTQVGGILEDWTRYYRYKNLFVIADKVEALHKQRKIEGKSIPIPARSAIPLLESASLEDDEILQDVWARLIANSTDPDFKQSLHPGYIEIIKQMSPDEVIILSAFLKIESYPTLFINHISQESRGFFWISTNQQASYKGIYAMYLEYCEGLTLKLPANARVYLDNLQRLRLVELGHDFSDGRKRGILGDFLDEPDSDSSQKKNTIPARDEYLRMTAFGESFVTACISKIA